MAEDKGHDADTATLADLGLVRPAATRNVGPVPIDPRWAQLAAMHASVLDRLGGLIDTMQADSRRKEALDGRAELVTLEEEYTMAGTTVAANGAAAIGSLTANYFLVLQITWSIPNAATGVITLGGRQIPIATQTNSVGARMLLSPNDVRSISSSVAGAVFLHLGGRILSPQAWLH